MEDQILLDEFKTIRLYLEEKFSNTMERWRIINQYGLKDSEGNIDENAYLQIYAEEHNDVTLMKYLNNESYLNDIKMIIHTLKQRDIERKEDFEFYTKLDLTKANPLRTNTNTGIRLLNLQYHSNMPVFATDDMPETGFRVAKPIQELIDQQYPTYKKILLEYCRPLGTTDATFIDFNKAQFPSTPPTPERQTIILELIKYFMDLKPYLPLHFESTVYAKLPLHTGTGYYDRSHYKTRALAKLTRPEAYKTKPTSKGYFENATHTTRRTTIHNFKHFKSPVKRDCDTKDDEETIFAKFIAQRATMLYTRNHISKLPKLKQRPVYNVDKIFLDMEIMLTFPILIQTRPTNSCLMYSYETIRGGCHELDRLARGFESYFTIDWSSFDQTLPRVICNAYYGEFLESLIVINKGYQRTIEYPTVEQDPAVLFMKMSNLLHCLHRWYISMVFITADGYAYQRTAAGVPSGLLNTQILDSFGNLYVILDGLLEYGFSSEEIKTFKFFIMGDDNSAFTHLPLIKLQSFITWFSDYAYTRWHMTLSQTKSLITSLRQKIEILSYTCNFGTPTRPIAKLVAQLCYPERQMKPKYMSYRAIGMAYAAAGSDPHFHQFCRDIYYMYYLDKADLDLDIKRRLWKHLPGAFKSLDPTEINVDFTTFPKFHEVRAIYSKWQGSLKYEPKWDQSYFLSDPFIDEDDTQTILQYRLQNNIERPIVEECNVNQYL